MIKDCIDKNLSILLSLEIMWLKIRTKQQYDMTYMATDIPPLEVCLLIEIAWRHPEPPWATPSVICASWGPLGTKKPMCNRFHSFKYLWDWMVGDEMNLQFGIKDLLRGMVGLYHWSDMDQLVCGEGLGGMRVARSLAVLCYRDPIDR